MAQFQLQRTLVFPKKADGQRYIQAVKDGDRGFVVKWHAARPSDFLFVTVEAVSRGDLRKLEKLANKMGSTGTTSEQKAPTTPEQARVDAARKERENARREAEQKERQRRLDQEKQAATRKQQTADRESKRETQRQVQDKEQAARAKRDAQIQKDAERRRAELARAADQRDRESEAPPGEEGGDLETKVAAAVEKGVKAAMGKKDDEKKKKKDEKKEGFLSFGEFIDEQPTNFAGQGTAIAGLGGDEPIVRPRVRRMKDCSKCRGVGCEYCIPEPVIIRRSARVAESVMRQLKAARIAREVVEQKSGSGTGGNGGGNGSGGNGGNGGAGNGTNGTGNGTNGNGNGENGKHPPSRGYIGGYTHGHKCPPGKIWDPKKKKCVKAIKEAFLGKKVEDLGPFGQRFILVFGAEDDLGAMLPRAKNRQGRVAKTVLTGLVSGSNLKKEIFARLKKHPRITLHIDRKMRPRTMQDAYYVDVEPSKGEMSREEAKKVLQKALGGLKVRGLTEDIEAQEVPVGPEQPTTFAGSPIFKVDPQTFKKCCKGKAKWARWSRMLNLEDEGHQAIRKFAYSNPKRPIVIQCSETGDMKFLRFNRTGGGGNRRKRKTALPPVDIQLDIEQTEEKKEVTQGKRPPKKEKLSPEELEKLRKAWRGGKK